MPTTTATKIYDQEIRKIEGKLGPTTLLNPNENVHNKPVQRQKDPHLASEEHPAP